MCGINGDLQRQALGHEQVHALAGFYGRELGMPIPEQVVCKLDGAMAGQKENRLSVEAPAVVAFLDSLARVYKGERAAVLRFSAIAADGRRFMTPIMELVHDSFLKLNMSSFAVATIKKTMNESFDLDLVTFCCCGTAIGEARAIDGLRPALREEEIRRTLADQEMPLIHADLEEIPTETLSSEERAAWVRIERAILFAAGLHATAAPRTLVAA